MIVNHAGKKSTALIPAMTKTALRKPIWSNSRARTMGKMTPPRPEPQRMRPIAVGRRRANQCEQTADEGVYRAAPARPKRAWARRNW